MCVSVPVCFQVRLLFFFFQYQDKRITASDALTHPYLDEGRLRFHSCMCKCCVVPGNGSARNFVSDFEPVCPAPFSYDFEDHLTSVNRVKGEMFALCRLIL